MKSLMYRAIRFSSSQINSLSTEDWFQIGHLNRVGYQSHPNDIKNDAVDVICITESQLPSMDEKNL